VNALSDGLVGASSDDQTIPRMTWWDHKGTEEWVEYDFPAMTPADSSSVYWFDDAPTGGGCRVPTSWRLEYLSDGAWKPVDATSGYGTSTDHFNKVSFKPVAAKSFRLVAQLQPGYSSGILEWSLSVTKTKILRSSGAGRRRQ
jgi:hypothetical protein